MQYLDGTSLIEQTLTRTSERKLFQQFLDRDDDGIPIADRIYETAKSEVTQVPLNSSLEQVKSEIVTAVINKYKQTTNTMGLSAYEEAILDLIAQTNNKRSLVGKIKAGKVGLESLPGTFPKMRKNAEVLFKGKVSSDLKEADYLAYRTEKRYAAMLREYAHELFFAVNNGLEEKVVDFLQLIYELNKIKSSEPITDIGLRRLILHSLTSDKPLELVHIKSLRFTYPAGSNLKILDNTAAVEQAGLPGEQRLYPTEEVIFDRIGNFRELLGRFGITTRVTLIVSDPDLDYCFPDGQNIVPQADIENGKIAAQSYVSNLRSSHPEVENIRPLTEYLAENNLDQQFSKTFDSLVRDCEQGGGKFISERILEMRVNQQFEHYAQMFGTYSRSLARQTSIQQISNLLSLSVIFESFPTTPLLIIDSRGFEDRLIGGVKSDSVVKFFTKLKDPTVIV